MARLAAEAERLLDDASPLVRGAAVWALSQLLRRASDFDALAPTGDGAAETDASVRAEWAGCAARALDFTAQSVMVRAP